MFGLSAPANGLDETRMAYSITFVVDEAQLLQEEGHIRYPDSEDYPVSYHLSSHI